jgi:hypothetical protein
MLRCEALGRIGVSEERIAPIRVKRFGELATTLAVTSNQIVFLRSVLGLLVTTKVPSSPILVTLMMEAICSFETSVITRAIEPNIPEDGILHTQSCENPKFTQNYF